MAEWRYWDGTGWTEYTSGRLAPMTEAVGRSLILEQQSIKGPQDRIRLGEAVVGRFSWRHRLGGDVIASSADSSWRFDEQRAGLLSVPTVHVFTPAGAEVASFQFHDGRRMSWGGFWLSPTAGGPRLYQWTPSATSQDQLRISFGSTWGIEEEWGYWDVFNPEQVPVLRGRASWKGGRWITTPTGQASMGGHIELAIEAAAGSEPNLSLLALFGVYLLLRWVDRAAPQRSAISGPSI